MIKKISKGIYRHYKGNDYEVIGTAYHTETLEEVIVYRGLYGNFELWVRPLHIFLGEVKFFDKIYKQF